MSNVTRKEALIKVKIYSFLIPTIQSFDLDLLELLLPFIARSEDETYDEIVMGSGDVFNLAERLGLITKEDNLTYEQTVNLIIQYYNKRKKNSGKPSSLRMLILCVVG